MAIHVIINLGDNMILDANICISLSKTIKVLGIFLKIIIYLIPIIIIISSFFDLYKVIIDGKSDTIKKTVKGTILRIVAGLIVLLIPTTLPVIFSFLLDEYSTADMCSECLLTPTSNRCEHLIEMSESTTTNYFNEPNTKNSYENKSLKELDDVPKKIRKQNHRATEKKAKTSEKNTKQNQSSSAVQQNIINAASNMSKQAEKDVKNGKKWYYLNSGCAKTFEQAEKEKKYKTNCALGVVWSLKTAGVLDENMSLYKKYENGIDSFGGNMSEEQLKQRFEIIDGNARTGKDLIKNNILQPGDVAMWYHQGHTNMYAGNNLWYDYGRNFTGGYGSMEEYYFKTFGPIRITYYEDAQVWKILRAK